MKKNDLGKEITFDITHEFISNINNIIVLFFFALLVIFNNTLDNKLKHDLIELIVNTPNIWKIVIVNIFFKRFNVN